jgi:hypothetical protein
MSQSEVLTEVIREVTPDPVEKNWAQAVSIGDLFGLLLKFSIAAVPFVIALVFLLPFMLSASQAFFAGATSTYR